MEQKKPFFGLAPNVFFSGLVSLCMDVSSEMIYPIVPLFLANVLGVNSSVIGLIEGVAESTASLLKVFSGWFSDQLGRRKGLMFAGYAVSTLSRPLMATAAGWQHVLAARFTDRLGKGIRTAPRDAIIAEATEYERLGRAFNFHRAMDTVGAVLGPGLSLWLLARYHNNFRLVFWCSMIPGLAALVLIARYITEQTGASRDRDRPRPQRPTFDWRVKAFIAISALFALGNSSDAFLILRAQQIGIPAMSIPAVYLAFNLIYSLAAVPAGIAADLLGKRRILLVGFVLFAGLYTGFARVRSVAGVWLLFCLYGLFMALSEGIQKAFLATIMPPAGRATAFGLHASAVGLAMLPASIIGGWLWDHVAPAATFYFGAATATLAALCFLTFMVVDRGPQAEQGLAQR